MTDRWPDRLRIATWNVHEGIPSGETKFSVEGLRADEVVDALDRLDVDAVALQELDVQATGSSLIMSAIAASTTLAHTALQPLSPSSFEHGHAAGLGIASRFPLGDVESGRLEKPDTRDLRSETGQDLFEKGWLAGTLEWSGFTLRLMSVHGFPFHRFGVEAGDARFAATWRRLAQDIDAQGIGPLIVAGDFNASQRELVTSRTSRALTSTLADITHHGKSVDDILLSDSLRLMVREKPFENFSDHKLCVVEVEPRTTHGA